MTQPRRPLPPSSKCQLAAVALSMQGEYGVVTELAREHGIHRQRIYDLCDQA